MLSDEAEVALVTFAVMAGLNAPFGARCFLTVGHEGVPFWGARVLMHLLALGAF